MAGNKNLHRANREKNDEFYTQLVNIENELRHYQHHFKNKIIFCNCDDPKESNFFRYFALNFNFLGIRKLIATHFHAEHPTYKLVLDRELDLNADGKIDLSDVQKIPLQQNGDFRSPECIELLKEADIVVTNPPFSLFREYVAQLMEYEKKFVIIGNKNAITYKELFQLIKENKIWIGSTPMGVDMLFDVPEHNVENLLATKKEGSGYKFVEGQIKARAQAIWFTNLDHAKRHEMLALWATYSPENYPHYDNYDAIEVSKVKDIPKDWDGAMGVPITFLDKYNPEQFEILSSNDFRKNENVPFKTHGLIKDKDGAINGKPTYVRILIKHKR